MFYNYYSKHDLQIKADTISELRTQ